MTDLINQAIDVLKDGGLVAIPTETVYGLAADASNPVAIKKIFSTKERPVGHPLIVHIANSADDFETQEQAHIFWEKALSDWARDIPREALLLAEAFWPGPLTIILPKAKNVLPEITGGQETVGLRCPNHPLALELLKRFKGGLAAPSANKFGHVSPTTAQHVREEFTDVLILDGGPCGVGIESTIIDLSRLEAVGPVILRPGIITKSQIDKVLDVYVKDISHHQLTEDAPRVSGSLSAHYAPKTKLVLYGEDYIFPMAEVFNKVAWVHLENSRKIEFPANLKWVECVLPNNSVGVAKTLYSTLRQLDKSGCDLILFQALPMQLEWEAVRDRLARAAAGSGVN